MKKYLKFLPYFLFVFCLTIVSCSDDSELTPKQDLDVSTVELINFNNDLAPIQNKGFWDTVGRITAIAGSDII